MSYVKSAKDREFNQACHLYGDDLCHTVKALIEADRGVLAKEELNNSLKNFPDKTKLNALKLIMFWSLEEAQRWFS